ncbi:uncharacterized protein LOC143279795 [Babylonia areolata]|uniref:uncharacterized protein LOC143279795 n=1 Tax=Babylonia areolata TaxID=304850 RepID=UPI003FD33D0C
MAAAVVVSGRPPNEDSSTGGVTGGGGGGKPCDLRSGGGGGGGGYSSAGHIYPPGSTLKDLAWDDKVRTLKDFVATYRLPLVARVRKGDLSKFLPPCGPGQDNVVQIHEVRRRKIVLARRLQWEKRQNDYIVSGEQVEVPASFKGWFEVVPDDGRPVEYFDTVGGICSIKPRRFLVRTPTVGYQLSIEDGVSCWMPHEIRPGEVLTTGMVYMDNNNNGSGGKKGKGGNTSGSANNNKGFFKRLLKSSKNKNKPEQDLKYLQCFDVDGKEIMIPLIMSGVFSPVGDASMANYDAVYELQDLIMAFGLPVNAQFIHANPREKAQCPQGVLKFYSTREEELAVLSRLEKDAAIADPAVEKVEVSVERELALQRGLPRRRQSVHSARPAPISSPTEGSMNAKVTEQPPEQQNVNTEVELPKRVPKELKKSKSTNLLDKLSVRKVRKERARLKELRSDDVFSKRIIRSELSYEDFFNGLDGDEEGDDVKDSRETDPGEGSSTAPPTPAGSRPPSVYGKTGDSSTPSSMYGTYGSARGDRKYSIQDRDLPPIPVDSSSGRHDSSEGSKDSLYEHLPPAPQPPLRSQSEPSHTGREDEDLDDEEDGYMVPHGVRGGDSAYSSSVDVQLRRKPPAVPKDVKLSRLKKCRSEMLPPEVLSAALASEDGSGVDIDQLFNFTDNTDRPYGSMAAGSQWAGSTSQLYGFRVKDKRGTDAIPAWRAEVHRQQARHSHSGGGTLSRKSVEQLDLETRSTHSGRSSKSRGQSHVDPNATIRSHNLRKNKAGLLELFHFTDSFRDLRQQATNQAMTPPPSPAASTPGVKYTHQQPALSGPQSARPVEAGAGDNPYGAVITPSLMPGIKGIGGYFRPQPYVAYADSEPSFRKSYPKATSVSGHSDSAYPKQGDDSAISMGSRGENPYGFNNDSEYSYNEYTDNGSGSTVIGREDNWSPPDDISGLSVHEVSRSLRYIGMKDRVVLRFANEQIDGSMLCSLDKRLLKEGFPELNALEIKKILDFVRGWRPKKR